MKPLLHSRDDAPKGAALIIVLAFVVLLTGLTVVYFSRAATDRQLAHSSSNDTTADLLARSALDIVVANLKQEIATPGSVTQANIQPQRSGDDPSIPNLIRRSLRGDVNTMPPPGVPSLASAVSSWPVDPTNVRRGGVTSARWNRHYLVPLNPGTTDVDSLPVSSFVAPDWVLVTRNGPVAFSQWQDALKDSAPANNNYVVGRYAFAVYDEGGLIDMNLGGFPTYASLTPPTRPARKLRPTYPVEESEIMLVDCQPPNFTPDNPIGSQTYSGSTGTPLTITLKINSNTSGNPKPTSFGATNGLPRGLSIGFDASNFWISGIPTSPGTFAIPLWCSNGCPPDGTGILKLTIAGFVTPDSTPWPVNLARKGTIAFADLTTLPSSPAITTGQINKLMYWRNYATTQQPTPAPSATPSPSFRLADADNYAKYFLGADYPLATSFTTVSTAVNPNINRTDQAAVTRQQLIKLQRTVGFPQSLLQYLGTFSRDTNRPAQDWPKVNSRNLTARFDMTNLQILIPGFRIRPGNNGKGHAWGLQKQFKLNEWFGLAWVNGKHTPGKRFTDPDYYGHWKYNFAHDRDIKQLSDPPDFFQIIHYATTQAIGLDPNDLDRIRNTFNIGAALIDLYDGDDLFDPDPNPPPPPFPPSDGSTGNTITIIDYGGADYAYGIEAMSYDDPNVNWDRPPFAPGPVSPPLPPPTPPLLPPQANYVFLNRRFENVGEFGYAYNPGSSLTSKTLDFASANSPDRALLDFFTYNEASPRAGIVNLNTRNGPVLASIIRGAWLRDQRTENLPPGPTPEPNYLVSRDDALAAGQAIVQETTSNGAALTRADIPRLAAAAAVAVPTTIGSSDETKQTIARALAEVGQARTWNLMIDVIAQTGHYGPNAQNLTDFIPEGEKRYWLHIALGRDLVHADGTPCAPGDSGCQVDVLGTQLEEVIE